MYSKDIQQQQTNFYLRSDNNMLHMSRYNMHNSISYRGGCTKKQIFRVDSADTQGRKTVSSTSSNRRRVDASSTLRADWVMIGISYR